MNKSEIKLSIFQEVDLLDDSQLEELYTFLHNFLLQGKSTQDWLDLSLEQKNGLKLAIRSIEEGQSMVNEEVLSKYKKRYSKD
jgi:DNA phosphorothioation-dependent restriction protein DptG